MAGESIDTPQAPREEVPADEVIAAISNPNEARLELGGEVGAILVDGGRHLSRGRTVMTGVDEETGQPISVVLSRPGLAKRIFRTLTGKESVLRLNPPLKSPKV